MENTETGAQSPQLFAIEQMKSQLDFSKPEQATSAIQNIATASLTSNDLPTKIKALDLLGEYAGK